MASGMLRTLRSIPGGVTAGRDIELEPKVSEGGMEVPGGFGAIGVVFCQEVVREIDSLWRTVDGLEMLLRKDICDDVESDGWYALNGSLNTTLWL